MNDSANWSAICADYDRIRRTARAYDLTTEWRQLLDGTRAGTATLADWRVFLIEVDRRADEEENLISKGDNPFRRRLAALRANEGDYVCASGRCDRTAAQESTRHPPNCSLFALPMTVG